MKLNKKRMMLEQIDKKINQLRPLEQVAVPGKGWINAVRTALGMSMRQLAARLNVTPQSIKGIEEREESGSITLNNLRVAANALGMKLVYAIVPKDESVEQMIEKRSLELAREIVLRTSHSMKLEDQEISGEQIEKSIRERAAEFREEMPRHLWD
jgi:predicted DNA-binding mobile mystery protein A